MKDAIESMFDFYYITHFNPRTREGCDRSQFLQCPALRKVLIHAPAGMRHARPISEITNRKVLIHAPVRGATQHLRMLTPASEVLIHAPVRGATAKSYKIGSDFSALFRKFIQKLGIVIFRISIF